MASAPVVGTVVVVGSLTEFVDCFCWESVVARRVVMAVDCSVAPSLDVNQVVVFDVEVASFAIDIVEKKVGRRLDGRVDPRVVEDCL